MQANYKKIIWSTLLFTLIALVVTFIIVSLLLVFVFTADLADFFYSMGNDKVASTLYYKAYEKNDDIRYCYKALNLKIKIDDEEGIVEIYNEYLSDDEYLDFTEEMLTNNEKINCTVLERSVILNDENYLENKYISALIDLNRKEDAFKRAVDNFKNYNQYDFKNQGLYNLNYFLSDKAVFNEIYTGYSDTLVNEMQNYFDNAYLIFKENEMTETKLNQSYLVSLGNRLIIVGQSINSVYIANNSNADVVNSNNLILQHVNDTIKGLI